MAASASVAASKQLPGTAVPDDDYSLEAFDLLKTIGTGTFARVYICRHRDLGFTVGKNSDAQKCQNEIASGEGIGCIF